MLTAGILAATKDRRNTTMPIDEVKPAGSTSPVAREKLEGMFASCRPSVYVRKLCWLIRASCTPKQPRSRALTWYDATIQINPSAFGTRNADTPTLRKTEDMQQEAVEVGM